MKLTKKQKEKLYNCHMGEGFLAFKSAENEIVSVEFCRGKNGKVYFITDRLPSNELNLESLMRNDIREEEE